MAQIVYVLTNPVMPGLVKIGKTDRENIKMRMQELFTTGVPVPFDCAYVCEVENNIQTEKNLHAKFANDRISERREFFRIETKKAIRALKPYELSDDTLDIRDITDKTIPKTEKDARKEARKKTIIEHPEYAEGKTLHAEI